MTKNHDVKQGHLRNHIHLLEQLHDMEEGDETDFATWVKTNFSLANAYRQAGLIDEAIRTCKKIFKKEIEKGRKYHNIDLHIFYAECLIDPTIKSRDNLLEAYEAFQLMAHYAYEARQKLAVQFGMAFCWAHNVPAKPKAEDIIPIGSSILEAFTEDWSINPALEEKERILRSWNIELDFFVDNFAILVPTISWEICEMMRARFLLIDLGHSMNYFLPNSSSSLLKEEEELARHLRELNDRIKQLSEAPPPQDLHSHLQRLDGPNSIASLDKQRNAIDRKRSYILHQLSQSSDRDKESVDLRTGASISYSELQKLLMMR